ncbi:MAG: hypothetical protein K0R38_2385 [Polyangiaceae bacterium]|jgi:hypothetical protein|nr:hypothetical protein [Polyangiaceae bacterium]
MRLTHAAALLLAAAFLSSPSEAAKPSRACIDAHAEGQVERDAGRLLRASERFRACAVEACPAVIRKECTDLGATLEAQTPSLVVKAEDTRGQAIPGARASIDAGRELPKLDGTAISLDPGVHQIDVSLPDGRRQTVHLSLSYGEKARPAIARFEAPKPLEPKAAAGGNALAYIIGGAGIIGLGAWGAFAYDGRRRQGDLETCAPRCSDRSEVDAMRRSYLIADVLLGLSAAALGTSAYLLITNTGEEEGVRERAVLLGARGRF